MGVDIDSLLCVSPCVALRKRCLLINRCRVLLLCLNSTSPTIAANEIDKRFNIDETSFPYSYWLVSSWSLSFAIVSLVVMPMMEEVGVRYGYLVSAIQTSAVDNPADAYEVAYTGFAVFVLPQAFAQNFATLIVARLFSGGCAGILTIVLGSIIGDVFEGERERTIPMNIFIFCYMVSRLLNKFASPSTSPSNSRSAREAF